MPQYSPKSKKREPWFVELRRPVYRQQQDVVTAVLLPTEQRQSPEAERGSVPRDRESRAPQLCNRSVWLHDNASRKTVTFKSQEYTFDH